MGFQKCCTVGRVNKHSKATVIQAIQVLQGWDCNGLRMSSTI